MISNALNRLERFAANTATETAFYPQSATLAPVNGGSSSTVRLRLAKALAHRNFSQNGQLDLTIERATANYGVFPPNVKLELGDRLTMLEGADVVNQVFEVTEPIKPDLTIGYSCGLAFVKGSR